MCTLISDKMDFKNNTRKKEGHFIMIKVHKCQYIRKICMYVFIWEIVIFINVCASDNRITQLKDLIGGIDNLILGQ